MQRPTLQNVRIRSTRDALQVFHGVALNRLPLITRRLDAEERRSIVAGNVYVWEERGANSEPTGLGMERWTDGMGWGPSRVRDEFLFYHQKESDVNDDQINPLNPWDRVRRRDPTRPSRYADGRDPPEPERLIKQTYSVHVTLPVDQTRGIVRKWHLTAYFSQPRLDTLDTIDNIRGVGDVAVPEGWFKSARAGKPRRDTRSLPTPPHPSMSNMSPTSPSYPHHYSPTQLAQYRELPPPHHTHSPAISDYQTTSSPSPTSSSPVLGVAPHPTGPSSHGQLVPLEVLLHISGPKRDPVDEQVLRLLGSPVSSHGGSPSLRPPSQKEGSRHEF
ncbi:hypothetical protein AX16_001165 [Volvariella volvacea WC 439]|nr:hypothetical protein AX16_001165 [Volvariella volvacea WC 439]